MYVISTGCINFSFLNTGKSSLEKKTAAIKDNCF